MTRKMKTHHRLILGLALALALGLSACASPAADAGAAAPALQAQHVSQIGDPGAGQAGGADRAGHGPHADHSGHAPLVPSAPLPGRSLYHLDGAWLNHRGEQLELGDLRGSPVVVVMFYASCDSACPLLMYDAQRLEAALPEPERSATQFVMVTIDPENDAPERLARYVEQNGYEAPNWHFLTGGPQQTRALAALLGVQYRPAGQGMFSHTNLITVLDPDGVVAQRTEGLSRPVEPAARAIAAMMMGR